MDGFACHAKHCIGSARSVSWIPSAELSRYVLRNIIWFHLRAHTLRVETGYWQMHNRHWKVWLELCPGQKTCPLFMPMHGNVLFEKDIQKTIYRFLWPTELLYVSETLELYVLKISMLRMWPCFSWSRRTNHFFSETMDVFPLMFFSGWQWPASVAVNPSGWRSKPIITLFMGLVWRVSGSPSAEVIMA